MTHISTAQLLFLLIPPALLLPPPPPAHAHGVNATIIQGGIGVQAQYDNGEPMAYAEVHVYAPDTDQEA